MTSFKIEVQYVYNEQYEYDLDNKKVMFGLNDWKFAPHGTFVDDFDWRFQLQAGDYVDRMDDEKDWYKSTILGTRMEVKSPGEPSVPEIYVGFRI